MTFSSDDNAPVSSTRRLAMTVAYDGSDFQGWQVQPDRRTVQEEIERAISHISDGARPRIHGSGRTDTGVHARGQVFHVDSHRDYSEDKWREALNGVLPEDVRILNVKRVTPDFHARFDALNKQYRYLIYNHPVLPPDLRRYRLHVRTPLNIEAMQQAAERLRGEHDFRSFSANRGREEQTTVRTLYHLRIDIKGPEICLIAEANGFMYKMVRQLAGALMRVGLGELTLEDIQYLLDNPERTHQAPTAAPQALFLWRVTYPESL
ncbi:MAG: tRNA pseudouridine(38-40) synthase TruA [Kiritimatiellae bacterium]|jgi:tRNA pseudouridine38-40 synthase|nr:tRNA pseudouridine(38-40) synthase TruA [Kiritimatiellia bacterium]